MVLHPDALFQSNAEIELGLFCPKLSGFIFFQLFANDLPRVDLVCVWFTGSLQLCLHVGTNLTTKWGSLPLHSSFLRFSFEIERTDNMFSLWSFHISLLMSLAIVPGRAVAPPSAQSIYCAALLPPVFFQGSAALRTHN